ncbi:MAG: hypothetical protein JWR80_2195 [Bradyrhizobium sp.]|nr:hypothetical protein [Bradyrhizobium sp.]
MMHRSFARHLVLHGLAVKKHATAQQVAELVGLDPALAEALLAEATATARAQESGGKYVLTPLARVALEGDYSRHWSDLRESETFLAAYEAFERINVPLKATITDWQTIDLGGTRVTNDHSDQVHDLKIIGRLGELHERADRILGQLEKVQPRFEFYRRNLLAALEHAEDGDIEWVSAARLPSYHTLWFELHEDLLRLLGRQRVE